MLAQQLLREGDLAGARAALQDQVRKDPSNARERVFLFQLLCVLGDWQRALTQLNVAAELDAANLPMAQTYREAIQCEALRAGIFKGRRAPLIFGDPPAWLAPLLEALLHGASNPELAASLRAQAFDAAPASSGSINDEAFAWLADADPRLGPVLEAIVNGRYFWIPFSRIRRIDFEAPRDLRDAVWTPASFTWTNGAETVGLIPARYDATATRTEAALLLARRTEWLADGVHADGLQAGQGLGQRMLVTDAADYPLLELRSILFDAADTDGAAQPGSSMDAAHHG